jgi:hypothetical protein
MIIVKGEVELMLRKIRQYFGENDKTIFEHYVYDWLNDFSEHYSKLEEGGNWINLDDHYPDDNTKVMVWVECIQHPVKHLFTGQKWKNLETINLPEYYEIKFWQLLPGSPI